MNVEIGAEAALFPEKEYINGIAVAVHHGCQLWLTAWVPLRILSFLVCHCVSAGLYCVTPLPSLFLRMVFIILIKKNE
jgi:hypothetical protein